jgi:N-acetylglucosaminyldiphosphoundecaprenol N-acetyl-beta-D-mannosaminyltransferase
MNLLGIKIDAIPTAKVLDNFKQYLEDGQKHHIITTNPEFVVEANKNPHFADIINRADLSLIDGIGILIGMHYTLVSKGENTSTFGEYWNLFRSYLKIQKSKQPIVIEGNYLQRTTGTDLVWLISQQDWMKFRKVYLLGGVNNVAAKVAKRLNTINPEIQFRFSNGHQDIRAYLSKRVMDGNPTDREDENRRIIEDINQFNPDVLLVAYGHPWQDIWIDSVRDRASFKIAIGVGGAFDYIAKEVQRAPLWVRDLGLEWAYRLFRDPTRYRRILSATWKFCNLLISQKKSY